MKIKIGQALGFGFGLILILLIATSVVGVVNVNNARTFATDVQESSAVLEGLHETNSNMLLNTIEIYHYFNTGDEEHLTEAEEHHELAEEEWESVKTLRSAMYEEEMQAAELAHESYHILMETSIAMYQDNPGDAAAALRSMNEAAEFFHTNVQSAQEAVHVKEMANVEGLVLGVNRMLPTAIILSVIALVLSAVAAYWNTITIVGGMTYLSEGAESISRGELDVPIEVKTSYEEIKDLGGSLDRMRASLKLAVQRLQTKGTSRK